MKRIITLPKLPWQRVRRRCDLCWKMSVLRGFLLVFLVSISTAAVANAAAETKDKAGDISEALRYARLLNQAFAKAVEKASPAVVVLVVEQGSGQPDSSSREESELREIPRDLQEWWRRQLEDSPEQGRGSGIVIREDGYILTNAHVVRGAGKITAKFKDGRSFEAAVTGIDDRSEVAVVKIEGNGYPIAKIGNSSKVRAGEFAIAIGAPFDLDYSATFGHISAKGRSEILTQAELMDQDFIQTDASINPGNSGGPLVNIEGEVIGINTIIRGIGTGIGFAIPSNFAILVAEQLIEKGKFSRSWIGVEITDFNEFPRMRDFSGGIREGVIVMAVHPLGPAANSELSAGDIVTRVAGKKVTSKEALVKAVRSREIGSGVKVDFVRVDEEGRPAPLTVLLEPGEYPERIVRRARSRWTGGETESSAIGISIMDMTPELAKRYRLAQETGVVVTRLSDDLFLEFLGPGDVVTRIDGHRVTGVASFKRATKNADLKKGVVLTYISDHPLRQDWERMEIVTSLR